MVKQSNILKTLLFSLVGIISGFLGASMYSYFNSTKPNYISQPKQNSQESYYNVSNKNVVKSSRSALEKIDFTIASSKSTNSVVYVRTYAETQYQRYSWMDMFFRGRASDQVAVGSGSGVIFSEDGYIVTNNHVIEDADKIEVVYNKKSFPAQIIGIDPSTDLALLKIDASNLPFIKVASSKELQVGEWVLAVGNPFNLNSTVTAGIVSAKGRRINILEDIFPIESFIQTDAAINPGNSGGALVNINGDLIGINTAILSKTGSYAGYGFAVPSDIVVKVIHDLKNYGEVQKAFLGVDIVDIDENLSSKLGLKDLEGVVITFIEKDGAAEKNDIEKGDVITSINDAKIKGKADYDEQMSFYSPGDKIQVTIKRDNKIFVKSLTLTNIEGTTGIIKREVFNASSLGAILEAVPKVERARLGIEAGIRIKDINRGLISRMGLDEGDIIESINNYSISSPEEFSEILEKIRGRVVLKVIDKNNVRRYYSYYF